MNRYLVPALLSLLLPASIFADTPAPAMNCDTHFAKETKTIDTATIEAWTNQATIQSFTFNYASMDNQLAQLKACYTDQGWQGFNDAMAKSGNIQSIKSNQLSVSSQALGKAQVSVLKENEWKVSLPLTVTYASKDQKIAQQLSIELIINRKLSGDLGIVQLIATPAKAETTKQ